MDQANERFQIKWNLRHSEFQKFNAALDAPPAPNARLSKLLASVTPTGRLYLSNMYHNYANERINWWSEVCWRANLHVDDLTSVHKMLDYGYLDYEN